MRISNRVCLVTGAAQGLGAAISRRFIEEGATVYLTDMNKEKGETLAMQLGERAMFRIQDVTNEAHWEVRMDEILKEQGRLDVLVNNAGILEQDEIENADLESFRRMLGVNTEGVFLGCKHAVRAMKKRKEDTGLKDLSSASIINVSSLAAIVGSHNLSGYSASKGAVRALTKSVALYCARKSYDIRCNSIHPGLAETQMAEDVISVSRNPERTREAFNRAAPLPGMVQPIDVANAALYLASSESRFTNGIEMVIDGGAIAQ
ncbi:MAG: glucose 1-dehydrogenase [Alphaproteobacteria bacterium]